MAKGTILAIDDHKPVLQGIEQSLKYEFEKVICIPSPESIPSLLRMHKIDVVLLDMNFKTGINTGNEGIYWLKRIKEQAPQTQIILMTAFADVKQAVKAMKLGAYDFVSKPWDIDELIETIQTAIQEKNSDNKEEVKTVQDSQEELIGESQAFLKSIQMAERVAKTDASVFIGGENGTGKNLLAKHIHNKSERKDAPFISIDLGSLHENLFESELFGHEQGAFTGADKKRAGKITQAQGGTLFLDEIANLNLNLQAKLLSFLQFQEYSPVGSNEIIKADVRLICASNKAIPEAIYEAKFREDLWYRINTVQIQIPALRERASDIPLLINNFLSFFNRKYERNTQISPEAKELLSTHQWPGNIRELRHHIENAVILSEEDLISADLFQIKAKEQKDGLFSKVEEMEKNDITKALDRYRGNLSEVARSLQISRTTLYKKIKKYGL